jgi:uncharacterized lipoprotein
MRTTNLLPLTAAAALLAIAGCDIEKTAEGEMPDIDASYEEGNMPEFEVRQTEEGRLPDVDIDVEGGKLPEYDVETPDVEVGTKTVEMTVPDIDVTMPDDEQPRND